MIDIIDNVFDIIADKLKISGFTCAKHNYVLHIYFNTLYDSCISYSYQHQCFTVNVNYNCHIVRFDDAFDIDKVVGLFQVGNRAYE